MPNCDKHSTWFGEGETCEVCSRPKKDRLDGWPALKSLKRIAGPTLVFHGGKTTPDKIKSWGALRGMGFGVEGEPKILPGGGTTNTVTTSRDPEASVAYLARGGGTKYLYAIALPGDEAIEIGAALELAETAQPGYLSVDNSRTQEVLALVVPWHCIAGWKVFSTPRKIQAKPANRTIRQGKTPRDVTLTYTTGYFEAERGFVENDDYRGTLNFSDAAKLEAFKLTATFPLLNGV